jgi:hypothetical protein
MGISIDSGDSDWSVFVLQTAAGQPVIVRSRLGNGEVRDFAAANMMARVRCALSPAHMAENGMPRSTDELDAFEDELIGALQAAEATTYPIVAVTGDGSRDYYFSAGDGGQQLVAALKAVHRERPFEIKPLRIDESKDRLIQSFTPA